MRSLIVNRVRVGKLKLTRLLIVNLLFCSACSTVHQAQRAEAPVVERSKTAISKDAAAKPARTAPPSLRREPAPAISKDTAAKPAGTAPPSFRREPAPAITKGVAVKPPGTAVRKERQRIVKSPSEISENPAVIALLDETDFQTRQGSDEDAVNAIERAIRLEPKNPYLWYRLAVLRFKNHQWRQAVALAEKSHSLSGRHPELQKANAELVRRARQATSNR